MIILLLLLAVAGTGCSTANTSGGASGGNGNHSCARDFRSGWFVLPAGGRTRAPPR